MKGKADKVAEAMRLYLGGIGKVHLRDEQRLYTRVSRLVAALAKDSGLSASNVWEQVEREARSRGLRTPIPGQHL